jgi:hypothetical protein
VAIEQDSAHVEPIRISVSQRQVAALDALANLDIVKISSCAALPGHKSGCKVSGWSSRNRSRDSLATLFGHQNRTEGLLLTLPKSAFRSLPAACFCDTEREQLII